MIHERTPEALRAAVASLDVERAEKYRRRDVTGDGVPETWCNLFVHDVTLLLGCALPYLRVNELAAWLEHQERDAEHAWCRVTTELALALAGHGLPVVALWRNPDWASHGHVALLVPDDGEQGVWIAQAGAHNFSRGTLASGFGALPVVFWAHA